MRAGTLRARVSIQKPTVEQNAVGEEIETWVTVVNRNGYLRGMSAREIELHGILTETRWELRLRYESALSVMTTKWRIVKDAQVFDIDSIINVGERNRELRLVLIEIE